jgi:hypothetical protein
MKSSFILVLSVIMLCNNPVIHSQPTGSADYSDLQSMTERDRKGALAWWYSWIGLYSSATAGQGIVALTSDDRSLRQDMVLGAATTFLGAAGTLLTPVVPGKKTLEKYGFPADDPIRDDDYYETMLREIAAREKAGRSWKIHAVAGAVNLGSGLVTWLGFKRTVWDGLINFAMNTAITEAQIWSQPMRAAKDYDRYFTERAGGAPPANARPESRIYFGSYPGGFTFRVVF